MAAAQDTTEEPKFSVPRFSSFKSKEPLKEPPKEPERSRETRKRQDRGDRSDGRSDEHHRPRHSRHDTARRHREERRRSRSREKTADRVVKDSAASILRQGGVPGLFLIDTKGDPLITKYDGIDKSQIPAYHRHGSGRVLGTVGRLIIHRDGPRDQFSLRMPGEGSSAFAHRDGLRSKASRIKSRPVILRARDTGPSDDEIEGYLPMTSSRKRKRSQRDGDSTDEDEQPSYRSIEGKAKPRRDLDSDSDEDSDAASIEITATDQNNPLKWKSMQLDKRVKDSPEDIDAWLELVDHQDALLRAGEDIDHAILENEAHSYTEIKVSMLESALSNTKSVEDRRRVLVHLMREGVKVWSSKAATKKWADVLKDEDDNFALWRTHLDFSTSNMTTFQYEDVKKMLLARMRHVLSRVAPDSPKKSVEEAIYVFLRTSRFVHDAGYKELAVAAWQGLLELNLFRPPQIDNQKSALESFHHFWESEVPRIGDAGAKGWRHFVESGGVGDAPEPVMDDATEPPFSRDAYKAWGYLEQLRAQKSKMPARTMDDGTEDDPFRVVMYSDIEPFLFLIPDSALADVTGQLVDAFLLFSGFPPAFRTSDWTEEAYRDQFLTSALCTIDLQIEKDNRDGLDDVQKKGPRFESGGLHAALSPGLLFGGPRWFQSIVPRTQNPVLDFAWMSETLRQLVHSAGVGGLAQYYMALCFSAEPATIKKPAKALLKRYPADSGLYNAYALAEFTNDPGVADKVLASATESSSLSAEWYGFQLFKTWSWIELETGSKSLAIRRLCSSVDETLRGTQVDSSGASSGASNATLLKAHQVFTSRFHEFLFAGDLDGASILAECLSLLSYLTAEANSEPASTLQGNISAAMSTVEVISGEFRSRRHARTAAHERVLQFAAQLLYLNASKGPFRRVYMREKLSRFIELFPRNTIFLSLFEWSDASLRVIDETRHLIHEKVLLKQHDCVSSRVFAIQHELARGNANTAKAAFEHAMSSDACRNSPVLWVSYIRFCHSQKQLRAKAKDVFFRALRHCPGSKEVVMEAFVTLIRDMESEDLRSVYNTMTSKGMRVHVDLEEFLVARREGASGAKRR